MKYDVLIIGAGPSGLMAMRELTKAGCNVCLLEATATAGGRIATINEKGFDTHVETGPEFIHGKLACTLQLLKEAGLTKIPVTGKMIYVQKGEWMHEEQQDAHWDAFTQRMHAQEKDITIAAFLQQYFSEEKYASLRDGVQHYAEGFDLADISKASILSAREEWNHQDETQYRIKEGYGKLVLYLQQQCLQHNGTILFDHTVHKIVHSYNNVTVYTINDKTINASKIIVTVPLGILQHNSIAFVPSPEEHTTTIMQLGFGAVIKILLNFKTAFWQSFADDIGFILSDEIIPTWWTQLPTESTLLTGWLGGPKAETLSAQSDEALLETALQSLAGIFNKTVASLQEQLVHHKIICWHNNPYIKGGYSYNTIESATAKKVLAGPVNNTMFFAGEAYYAGESQGTVEAALQSGLQVAKLLQSFL